MTNFCKTIVEYMDCPCEVFENESDYSKIHNRYIELLEKGKNEGFTPLIISVDDHMTERFEENGDVTLDRDDIKARRKADIESAEKLDALNILSANASEYEPEYGKYDDEYSGSAERFTSISDFNGGLVKEIMIALIPTNKPWELAIYAPMGGFNDCPSPDEQAAVFKYWYQKYGAVPAAVSRDVWELYVQEPISDEETAMKLAGEMYNFCYDIVEQGIETIGALAGAITDSHIWYFWWD